MFITRFETDNIFYFNEFGEPTKGARYSTVAYICNPSTSAVRFEVETKSHPEETHRPARLECTPEQKHVRPAY